MRTYLIGLCLFLSSCSTCPKFVDYQSSSVNVKGIQSSLPAGTPLPVKFDVGEVSIDRTNNREASQSIQQMDLLQNSICKQIDSMPDSPKKQHLREQYVTTLISMLETTKAATSQDELVSLL